MFRILFPVFLCVSLLAAHQFWFERHGEAVALHYGHLDPAAGEKKDVGYAPEQAVAAGCPLPETKDYPLAFPAECGTVYVSFAGAYWSKTLSGTKPLAKDEAEHPLKSWISHESVKLSGKAETKPLSSGLELVNETGVVPEGEKMHLRLFKEGKPAAGAAVAINGKVRGTTGEDGRINLRVREEGVQRIEATLRLPGDGVKADEAVWTTTLVTGVME